VADIPFVDRSPAKQGRFRRTRRDGTRLSRLDLIMC